MTVPIEESFDYSLVEEKISGFVTQGLEELSSIKKLSTANAALKASHLLLHIASLAEIRKDLENQAIAANSTERVVYNQVLDTLPKDLKITDKRLIVDANPSYISERENLEWITSRITYIKTMIEVFNNGHILFRQMMREDT